ncbi:transmembrane protein 98-like [Sycon ciliatum]|uniref:transmembrane protein 98-like n=1 Tax=Sycon ciliatum TaxID=27933 RepID=UPI0020ACEAA7|eukprot:scpid78889/ scgid9013/ Transmembrane protein 98
METVVSVAIGVLVAICCGAALAIAMICKHRYCGALSFLTGSHNARAEVALTGYHDAEQNEELIENMEDDKDEDGGLIPHCLDILKLCHKMTDRLVAITVKSPSDQLSPEQLNDIIAVAKKITPRVDDVVKSLYPPLDPILIEARATALHLSVNHLVLVCKSALVSINDETLDWVEADLASMSQHLEMIREIAQDAETAIQQVNQMQLQAAVQNMQSTAGNMAANQPTAHFSIPQQRVFLSTLGSGQSS